MEEPDAALEFERLVVLGPRIAAEQLRADRAKLKGFLARLLALCCPYGDVTAPSCTQATRNALRVTGELSKWVLFLGTKPNSGENPEEYIRRIQEAYGHTSKVCGRIWGKGYVAYRCRTCGMSPCSAICHECFEKGPHRNHNFLMYRSVAGGCCDCGDPGAWKPSGFCCDHKGPTTTFSLPLPDDELLSTFVAIYAVMEHVTLALKDFYQAVSQGGEEEKLARLPPPIRELLHLLQRACVAGDVYRRIVCSAALQDIGGVNPDLRERMQTDESGQLSTLQLRESESEITEARPGGGWLLESLVSSGSYLSVELSTLFLQMLFDYDFKRDFTRVFIRSYSKFINTILAEQKHNKVKDISTRMVDISVQLFSNSLLTVEMIRDEELLSTLLQNILSLVEEQGKIDPNHAGATVGGEVLVNCENLIWTNRTYWPITNDLVNILSHRAVVAELLRKPHLVSEWLRVILRFQGLDPHVRRVTSHIQQEHAHWTSPFFIELELVMEQLSLVDAGVKDMIQALRDPNDLEKDSPLQLPELLSAMHHILALGIDACTDWLRSSPSGLNDTSRPVRSSAVSLHIPLHRFVAFFASQMCRYSSTETSLARLLGVPDPEGLIRQLLSHPLRIQVLLAQIRAGVWRRNGETMLRRGWFYRSSYFYDLGLDLDIFLLQCAAVLLPADELVLTCVDNFELARLLGLKAAPESTEADIAEAQMMSWDVKCTLLEDLVVMIAAVISERARLGLTDRECIRQEVVARLSVRPMSHSQLTDSICRRWHEHDDFEPVLLEVADYEPPKSERMEQGKYRLRPLATSQQHTSLIHLLVRGFSHADYEAALEQTRTSDKAITAAGGGIVEDSTGSVLMQLPCIFENINLVLQSPVLHHIIFSILCNSKARGVTSVQINMALWLLQAALETAKVPSGDELLTEDCQAGSVASQRGCVFSSRNILINMDQKLPRQNLEDDEIAQANLDQMELEKDVSIESLLMAMEQSGSWADCRPPLDSVLLQYRRRSVAMKPEESEGDDKMDENWGGEAKTEGSEVAISPAGKDQRDKDLTAAKERQAAMLASFAAQQKLFSDAMLADDDEEEEEKDSESVSGAAAQEDAVECVICSQVALPDRDKPVGIVGLAQRSRMLAAVRDKASAERRAETYAGASNDPSWTAGAGLSGGAHLHVQSCRHHMHTSCFEAYMESLEREESSLHREQSRIDSRRGLFHCPMCRQLANVLIPLVPNDTTCSLPEKKEDVPMDTGSNDLALSRSWAHLVHSSRGDRVLWAGLGTAPEPGTVDVVETAWHESFCQESVSDSYTPLAKAVDKVCGRMSQVHAAREALIGGPAQRVGANELEIVVQAVGMTVGCLEVSDRDPSALEGGARRDSISSAAVAAADAAAAGENRVPPPHALVLVRHLHGVAMEARRQIRHSPDKAVWDTAGQRVLDKLCGGVVGLDGTPLLGTEMYSVLVRGLYAMDETELRAGGRELLLRVVVLAVLTQAFLVFHAIPSGEVCDVDSGMAADSGVVTGSSEFPMEEASAPASPMDATDIQQPADAGPECGVHDASGQEVWPFVEVVRGALRDCGAFEAFQICESGASVRQGFDAFLRSCLLPLLRRAAMLFWVQETSEAARPWAAGAGEGPTQEWVALSNFLRLEGAYEGATLGSKTRIASAVVGAAGKRMVEAWIRQAAEATSPAEQAGKSVARLALRACPVRQTSGLPLLIELPHLYHDLYMSYRDRPCQLCDSVPLRPALCLACGALCCFASECCRAVNVPGAVVQGEVCECFAHAARCGAGTAALLLLKTSMVLLLRETHWCIWGSPYLDAYGEEDPELKRGRPLRLNRERYAQLQVLHSTHGLDHYSRVASSWHVGAHRY